GKWSARYSSPSVSTLDAVNRLPGSHSWMRSTRWKRIRPRPGESVGDPRSLPAGSAAESEKIQANPRLRQGRLTRLPAEFAKPAQSELQHKHTVGVPAS